MPTTLSDLAHFTLLHTTTSATHTFLHGTLTHPEQLNRNHQVNLFRAPASTDDDLSAIVTQLDRPARTATLSVHSNYLTTPLTPGTTFPVYGSYYDHALHLTLNASLHWTHTPFTPLDAFEQATPTGGQMWRAVEPGDELRTDGKIVRAAWDHEHCEVCNRKIGVDGDGSGFRSSADNWVCTPCYHHHIHPRDLSFLLHGPHDPDNPRTPADDAYDRLEILIKLRDLPALRDHLQLHPADANAMSRYHRTPLMSAASEGDLASIDLLLSHGANPNPADTTYTPLSLAAHANHTPAVLRLLAAGATPNLPSSFFNGSLLSFVKSGPGPVDPNLLAALIRAGAS